MRRRWLDVVFVLYLAFVAFAVFGANPGESLDRAAEGVRRVETEVRDVVPGGRSGTRAPVAARDGIGSLDAEAVGNIVMFVPFGVLFPTRWCRWAWWTIPVGVALSAGVELTQLLFLSWRSPSFIDIWWNGLGVVLGFVLWLGVRAVLRRRSAAA